MVTGQESKGESGENMPTSIRVDMALRAKLEPLVGTSKKYSTFTHFFNVAVRDLIERELSDQKEGENEN
jgi:Arc/MetJ family transcription regulator